MTITVASYNNGSSSIENLRQHLPLRVIRTSNSRFRGNPNRRILNWGCSSVPESVRECQIFNKPEAVNIASNKLTFFNCVKDKDISIPDFTSSIDDVTKWLEDGKIVVARQVLRGHSGNGIAVFQSLEEWKNNPLQAPLFTKYIPKMDEYRVHVFNGVVIDVQRKARARGRQVDWRIRNSLNGFVFVREDCNPHQSVLEEAVKTISAVNLDFGAVDVIWNERYRKAYVLEVNTAPGLTGTTALNYAKALGEEFGEEVTIPETIQESVDSNFSDEEISSPSPRLDMLRQVAAESQMRGSGNISPLQYENIYSGNGETVTFAQLLQRRPTVWREEPQGDDLQIPEDLE